MPWLLFGPEVLPLLIFLISFQAEPRRFRTGVYLFLGVGWFAAAVLTVTVAFAAQVGGDLAPYVVLGLIAVAGLTVAGLAVFLIIAGITLVRREGFNPRRLLSSILGAALLGFLALVVVTAVQSSTWLLSWLLLIGLPAGYLGVGFASFVLYGAVYPAWMARYGPRPAAVVVLGSGLIQGRVPPLLADRVRAGRRVFERAVAAGASPLLITSGGKGPDEPLPEAVAMRELLVSEGMDPALILTEERSRNTRQNLDFTAKLLAEHHRVGPVAVVTSDFHALRAAFLMRAAKVPGYAVGARTARYFWPTAVIREYAAVLRDHFWLNAVLFALCCVPLGLVIVQAIGNRWG